MMKSLPRFILVFALLFSLVAAPVYAGSAKASNEASQATPGSHLASLVTQVTGIAISPLLGVSAVGAYQYFKAHTPEQKAQLPWFAKPMFWALGLLIAGACGLKDSLGVAIPPGLKKPFDMLELAENKLSGLVATGAVVPVLVNMASKYLATPATADNPVHVVASGLAMIQFGAIHTSWLLTILMVPLSVAVFLIVWVVSHAINVLILLSPWGAVDAALKTFRTAILGLVTATAFIDPVVGATISVAIIIVAYFCAGWAFRLTVFGSVFLWDFGTFRRHRFQPAGSGDWVFVGQSLKEVPIRTYGRLTKGDDGKLHLSYRPLLVMPERTAELPSEGIAVGRGLFWPTVEHRDPSSEKTRTLLTLPPRYKGHEEAFARAYASGAECEVGLRRGWALLRELLGGHAASRPAVAS